MKTNLLEVKNLKIEFYLDGRVIPAVNGVNLDVASDEIVVLAGESGSGKTVSALAITRLLPANAKIISGQAMFRGRDLLKSDAEALRAIRGKEIAYMFQEPTAYLNPVYTVGEQINEAIMLHQAKTRKEARPLVLELLELVRIKEPQRVIDDYPHQLSGGMNQRVFIAMALACKPKLLIADEPTTSLDVTIEAQILDLLVDLKKSLGFSLLFITHNLNIMKRFVKRIGIMYAGRMLEQNHVEDFFEEPLHPYSRGLLDSIFRLKGNEKRLKAIPGFVPRLSELPEGCKFHPRCTFAMPKCKKEEPPIIEVKDERWVRCYLYQN
jgi:peptide/nickel transport system ATP-binding protein/oligopeptide transport system ATP-binding protein